jgi:hypothetical protein
MVPESPAARASDTTIPYQVAARLRHGSENYIGLAHFNKAGAMTNAEPDAIRAATIAQQGKIS